jgi:hypothetical protein
MPSDFDLRTLDEEPPTPSRVDVGRAIADGRRRRTRRGVGYAGAATLTAVALVGGSVAVGGLFDDSGPTDTPVASNQPQPVTPPTACTLEQLPVPDGEPMALTSGAAGSYIVGRTYPEGGGYRGVIWHDGQPTAVDLPGDEEESLADVNSSGTAVGWSFETDGPIPYVYSDDQLTRLPGQHGQPVAINDAGTIIGNDAENSALVWSSATAEPTSLPLPEGATSATATDIDEDGTIVGNVDNARPYVWLADGTHRELPLPALDDGQATTGRVFTVRNGWATGWASTGDEAASGQPGAAAGDTVPLRWNLRTGETRTVADFAGAPDAVNAQGWMVGLSTEGRAVLVTDAGTVALPELAPHEPGQLTNIPGTVSDDGSLITGQSDDATDTIQPVVWRCE